MARPGWRDPTDAELIEATGDLAIKAKDRADTAATLARQALRQVDQVKEDTKPAPAPDVRDLPGAVPRAILGEEDRATLARTPPAGRRWRQLAAIDQRVETLERRRQELFDELGGIAERIRLGEEQHRQELADWMVDTSKPRPTPAAPQLEERRDQIQVELDASAIAIDKVLVEKKTFIERHRKRLARGCEQEIERVRARIFQLVDEIEQHRDQLADLSDSWRWTLFFPDPVMDANVGTRPMAAYGLMKPVLESLGVRTQVPIGAVYDLVKADAGTIASRLTVEQREQLGTAPPPTPLDRAMWLNSDEYQDWARRERQKLAEEAPYMNRQELGAAVDAVRADRADPPTR
jgi:hypothetical protein